MDDNLVAREQSVLDALKRGAKVPEEVAIEFVEARQALQLSVLADTYGGLLGPDAVSKQTADKGDRYERALTDLEGAVN